MNSYVFKIRFYVFALLLIALLSGCGFLGGQSERPENAIIGGINYVALTVSDLDESTALYQAAFGLDSIETSNWKTDPLVNSLLNRDEAKFKTRLLRSVNGQVRLFEFEEPADDAKLTPYVEVNGPGIAHICMQVDAKTKTYQKFLDGGAIPVGGSEMVQLNPRNPVYYAYARDRDSIMFEIEHVDLEKLDLATPPKNDRRMRHVALASPDIDRLVDFYSVLLEQKRPRQLGRFKAMSGENFDSISGLPETKLKMAFFDVRNMELEIAEYVSHPTKAPDETRPFDSLGHSMIVFDTRDVLAAKELLERAGGTVVDASLTVDGEPIVLGRDPDGNLIGFQSLLAESVYSSQNFVGDGT